MAAFRFWTVLLVAVALTSWKNKASAFVVSSTRPTLRPSSAFVLLATTESPFDSYAVKDASQGLATKDVIVGTGEAVKTDDLVTVGYKGRLMDHTKKEFDSSESFSFKLGAGRVMPGWEQGLAGMCVGGTRILRIPPNLGYGERGAKDGAGNYVIPPNADLEFEVEVKDVSEGTAVNEFMASRGLGVNAKTFRIVGALLFIIFLPQILSLFESVLGFGS